MTSVSAGHIILKPTQLGSGRPQWESNPGPPHQKSRALPTELPRPPRRRRKEKEKKKKKKRKRRRGRRKGRLTTRKSV